MNGWKTVQIIPGGGWRVAEHCADCGRPECEHSAPVQKFEVVCFALHDDGTITAQYIHDDGWLEELDIADGGVPASENCAARLVAPGVDPESYRAVLARNARFRAALSENEDGAKGGRKS